MKTAQLKTLLVSALLVSGAERALEGQSYSIGWFKVAGGGGTSTGNGYALSGTIGQDDAGGPMIGGGYALSGGFWNSLTAVSTPVAPGLTIVLTSSNTVVISWPSPASGWVLQQSSSVQGGSWTTVTTAPVLVGGRLQVIQPSSSGSRFYRLVLVPAAPTLLITHSGNKAILSWLTTAPAYVLEHSPNLATPNNWSIASPSPVSANGFSYVTNTVTAGNNFYRLRFP